jgi:hypothetical protein
MAEDLPNGRRIIMSVGITAAPHPSSSIRLMMLPAMSVSAKPQRCPPPSHPDASSDLASPAMINALASRATSC